MIFPMSEQGFRRKRASINDNVSDTASTKKIEPRRCASMPALHTVSIMKTRTLDESLHSTYGSSDGERGRRGSKRCSLQFDKVKIREYSRTVGDNPSCSSGPPIR